MKLSKSNKADIGWNYVLAIILGLVILLIAIIIIGKSGSTSLDIVGRIKSIFG